MGREEGRKPRQGGGGRRWRRRLTVLKVAFLAWVLLLLLLLLPFSWREDQGKKKFSTFFAGSRSCRERERERERGEREKGSRIKGTFQDARWWRWWWRKIDKKKKKKKRGWKIPPAVIRPAMLTDLHAGWQILISHQSPSHRRKRCFFFLQQSRVLTRRNQISEISRRQKFGFKEKISIQEMF